MLMPRWLDEMEDNFAYKSIGSERFELIFELKCVKCQSLVNTNSLFITADYVSINKATPYNYFTLLSTNVMSLEMLAVKKFFDNCLTESRGLLNYSNLPCSLKRKYFGPNWEKTCETTFSLEETELNVV